MLEADPQNQSFNWGDLSDSNAYAEWRAAKLSMAERAMKWAPVEIADLSQPTDSERAELNLRCRNTNFAHYLSQGPDEGSETVRTALRSFTSGFGLKVAELHRSAKSHGIVALQVSQDEAKRGYIPYTSRSMNWHTDGYYNAPEDYVAGFVLHCARPAATGGVNELLDPEIAYIRLRDRDPALVLALMHSQAMSIPANQEPDGKLRPESVGPVFFPDPATGRLQMRYTARTRSITWRDDRLTCEAEAFLREHLTAGDPLARRLSLAAGEGILNNNVLHNRTEFADQGSPETGRLIYRVRFHDRVEGS